MRRDSQPLSAYFFLVGAVALWGGNWVAVRYAVQEVTPLIVVSVRSVLAAVILISVLIIMKGKRPPKKDLWKFALLGLFGLFSFNIFQYTGLKFTTAINGSLINAATPILIILYSRLIFHEKLNSVQLFGVFISFVGVGWVITNGSWEVIRSLSFNVGDLLLFIASICWAGYTIYSRKPTLEYSALTVTAYASLFAAIYFAPFGIVQYNLTPVHSVSWGLVLSIIYAVAVAVLGLVAWIKGVSMIGPSKASIFMNLMPLFTLAFAFVLLGETITIHQIIGGIFVIGGVYLTTHPDILLRYTTTPSMSK